MTVIVTVKSAANRGAYQAQPLGGGQPTMAVPYPALMEKVLDQDDDGSSYPPGHAFTVFAVQLRLCERQASPYMGVRCADWHVATILSQASEGVFSRGRCVNIDSLSDFLEHVGKMRSSFRKSLKAVVDNGLLECSAANVARLWHSAIARQGGIAEAGDLVAGIVHTWTCRHGGSKCCPRFLALERLVRSIEEVESRHSTALSSLRNARMQPADTGRQCDARDQSRRVLALVDGAMERVLEAWDMTDSD